MELKRRHSLGLYIYKFPKNQMQRDYNAAVMERAEAIRCKVFIEVLNERYDFSSKDKLKASFLDY